MNKYIITRTSACGDKPCEEAIQVDATYILRGIWKTLEEAKKDDNGRGWFFRDGTTNHREEDGGVCCDKPFNKVWIVEIESIEKFCDKYEMLVVSESSYKEYPYEIEIYDDYRE